MWHSIGHFDMSHGGFGIVYKGQTDDPISLAMNAK
jgi:hypothetical protein